jgi:hypothetical protein
VGKNEGFFSEYVRGHGFPTIKEGDTYAKEHGYLLSSTFTQRLNSSWGQLAISYGYDLLALPNQRWSDQELLTFLKEAIKKQGNNKLTKCAYNIWAKDKDVPSAASIANRLGRGLWKRALEKAYVPVEQVLLSFNKCY